MKLLHALGTAFWEGVCVVTLDVDGVLTTGEITYSSAGDELKTFDARDGAGIACWHLMGYKTAIITGRGSSMVERRAEELGIGLVLQNQKDKSAALDTVLSTYGVTPEACVHIGDDLPDLAVMRRVGAGIAVADAVEDVKAHAAAVTQACGGRGAVREVIETALRAQNRWDGIVERFWPPAP